MRADDFRQAELAGFTQQFAQTPTKVGHQIEVKHALLVHPLDQLGGAIGRLPVFDKETRQTRCVEVEQVGASGRDGLGHGR
jgi:hypothetical protein